VEVDGLGGGREVGRLEFPKKNLGSRIAGRNTKTKMRPRKKNSEKEEKNMKKKFQNTKNYQLSKLTPRDNFIPFVKSRTRYFGWCINGC
jgi:hypothetical protein